MPRQARVAEEVVTGEVQETEQGTQPRGAGGRGINHITLVGRLARDPDVRTTTEGVARAWFVLAVPRPFAGRDGERDADFISVVAWRQLATTVGEHLTKGRLVGVTGRLRVETFDAGDGSRKSTTEVTADQVVFLDPPRKATQADS